MKYALIICAVLAVTFFKGGDDNPTPAIVDQTPKTKSVFVLFENGGSVPAEEQDDSVETALYLLQQLSELGKHKATRDVRINIITSATPNRIAWGGSAQQLLSQAEAVKSILTFRQSFSDIGMAFETIATTINIERPDQVQLYTIGPFIDVPFQNTTTPIEVKVPQAISGDLALTDFMDRLITFKAYRVHPDQIPELNLFLTINGLKKRALTNDVDFALLGAAQTRSTLNDLL